MLFYDWFARVRGWPPPVVDELTDEQLFWFPVMESARDIAIEQVRDK